MRIFICDDEEIFREEEKRICEAYFGDKEEVEIIQGCSGKDVIAYGQPVDILLLDIDMPKMDGIEIKDALQEIGEEIPIVFITNHEERMREAFGKNVIGFVDKGKMEEEIPRFLGQINRLYTFRWIEGEDGERYNSREVNYIKTDGRNYIRLYKKDGESVLLRRHMKEMQLLLEEVDFLFVHREYLVNMREITKIEKTALWIGDTEIPISVRKSHMVKETYQAFRRKRMRYQ